MKIIDIPDISKGDYQYHVLAQGHIPGVLSGAELKGKARNYGQQYARSRESLYQKLFFYGVHSELALVNSRWSRVWVDDDENRVKLNIVES